MLTARGDEADRVVGLEMALTITSPSLSARANCWRAVKGDARRAEPPSDSPRTIEVGKLGHDPASYRVSQFGEACSLSTLEFRLLYYLASRPNRVFTRDQLLDAVWGTDRFVTAQRDVYVRRLPRKSKAIRESRPLKDRPRRRVLFETRAA